MLRSHRSLLRNTALIGAVLLLHTTAFAEAYPGQQILLWASANIIAPLGLFALVISLAGAVFMPQVVRQAIYAVIVSVVLYFVIASADTIISRLRGGG